MKLISKVEKNPIMFYITENGILKRFAISKSGYFEKKSENLIMLRSFFCLWRYMAIETGMFYVAKLSFNVSFEFEQTYILHIAM